MFAAVYPFVNQQPKPTKAEELNKVAVTVQQVPVTKPSVEPVLQKQAVAPNPPVAPKPIPQPKTYTGTKFEWLAQAGVPESDWQYADYIVSKESSWNPSAVNKSSGACSLAQALPCSKIPGDWRDPVNALKWQYQYVKARYGGYHGAYNFWVSHHWY